MSWRSKAYLLSDLESKAINNEYPVRPDARRIGSRLGSEHKDCWSARFMVMAVCAYLCVCACLPGRRERLHRLPRGARQVQTDPGASQGDRAWRLLAKCRAAHLAEAELAQVAACPLGVLV